jgi:putative transposase
VVHGHHEHPTAEGKVYLAVVLDAFSRRVIGWSIADHMRAELVADALQMATWRRHPLTGPQLCPSEAPQIDSSMCGAACVPPWEWALETWVLTDG